MLGHCLLDSTVRLSETFAMLLTYLGDTKCSFRWELKHKTADVAYFTLKINEAG
jgi:hypothetical protein